jgi:hypothetical protein
LNKKHRPHSNQLSEHYCSRWISISLLKEFNQKQKSGIVNHPIAGIQRSHFFNTNDEYLGISIARPAYPSSGKSISITLGILLDKNISRKIRFADDPNVPTKEVNTTCERCPIENCAERVANPTIINIRNQKKKVEDVISRLIEKG